MTRSDAGTGGDAGTPPERLPRAVWILSAVGFLISLGFGLIAPALPALAELYVIPATAASLAISGFAAFRLLTNAAFGGMLRKFRLRNLLIFGLTFQAVTSVIAGFAPDGFTFLLFRALGGIGSAALLTSGTALLLALVSDRQRGKAMSAYFGANALGQVSGPALGGVIAIADPRMPLVVYGVILVAAAAVTFFALVSARDVRSPDAQFAAGEGPTSRQVTFGLLRNPLFLAVMSCQIFGGWVFYGLRTTIVPLHLGIVGYVTGAIGAYMAVASLLQVLSSGAAGTASDRYGRLPILLIGLVGSVGGLLVLAFSTDPVAVAIAFVVMGVTGGATAVVPAAMLGDVPLGGSGPGVAIYWILFDAAAIVGPIVSGIIADTSGYEPSYLLALIPFFLASGMSIYALGRRQPTAGG